MIFILHSIQFGFVVALICFASLFRLIVFGFQYGKISQFSFNGFLDAPSTIQLNFYLNPRSIDKSSSVHNLKKKNL